MNHVGDGRGRRPPLPFGAFLLLAPGLQLLSVESGVHLVPEPVIFAGNVRGVLNDQGVIGLQPQVLSDLQEAVDGRDLLLPDAPFLMHVLAG